MNSLQVFYKNEQSVPSHIQLPSPSASKPTLLVKRWLDSGKNIKLVDFNPVTKEDFYLAHDPKFVEDVLTCRVDNGFETRHPEVAAALPWTTGSFYAAALNAYQNKTITCSPVAGFHHATYDTPMGFCTFNGLMVTTIKLRQQFPDIKIGILDCDHHYGNGTDDIIFRLGVDYVSHYTFGGQEAGDRQTDYRGNQYQWKGGPLAENWIQQLPFILEFLFKDCDLILYQAGADPHKDDPHGGALSTEQLAKRDTIIFDYFSQRKVPVCWNLAGGYQQPIEIVLNIHDTTLDAALMYQSRYF
jgi:acetoin utilization deacetylase AcuC-like enzyme